MACIERDIDMALLSVCLSVFPSNADIVSKRLFDSHNNNNRLIIIITV